jgi:hypothetical protein
VEEFRQAIRETEELKGIAKGAGNEEERGGHAIVLSYHTATYFKDVLHFLRMMTMHTCVGVTPHGITGSRWPYFP